MPIDVESSRASERTPMQEHSDSYICRPSAQALSASGRRLAPRKKPTRPQQQLGQPRPRADAAHSTAARLSWPRSARCSLVSHGNARRAEHGWDAQPQPAPHGEPVRCTSPSHAKQSASSLVQGAEEHDSPACEPLSCQETRQRPETPASKHLLRLCCSLSTMRRSAQRRSRS